MPSGVSLTRRVVRGEAGCQVDVPVPVSGAKHFLWQSKEIRRAGKTFQLRDFDDNCIA